MYPVTVSEESAKWYHVLKEPPMKIECSSCLIVVEMPSRTCPECLATLPQPDQYIPVSGPTPPVPQVALGNVVQQTSQRLNWPLVRNLLLVTGVLAVGAVGWQWWRQRPAPPPPQPSVTQWVNPPQGEQYPQGKVLWSFATQGRIVSRPAVDGEHVYISSEDKHLYAVDRLTGALRWKFATAAALSSSPAVDGENVYVGSQDQHVYALDRMTGALRWKAPTQGPIHSSPAITAAGILIGSHDRHAYALDPETGRLRWRRKLDGAIFSMPLYDGVRKEAYFTTAAGSLYALSQPHGEILWRFQTPEREPIFATAALAPGLIAFTAMDRYFYGIDQASQQVRFRINQGPSMSSPFFDGTSFYFGNEDGEMYARLKEESGKLRWSRPVTQGKIASPLVLGDTLYVGTQIGEMLALDALTGQPRWVLNLGAKNGISGAPALVAGTLYIGAFDGKLYAIE
jgi:outer membrane protein assembly factor BamB